MRIHYIVPTFAPNPTGFAIAFFNIVNVMAMSKEVSEIIIYTPEEEQPEISIKVKYVRIKDIARTQRFVDFFGENLGVFMSKFYLFSELNKIKYKKGDLIYVESIFLSHISLILTKKYGQNNVITRIHGALPEVAHWTKDKFRLRMMNILLKLNNLSVTTYHYIDYLHQYFSTKNVENKKYTILPNTLPEAHIKNIVINEGKLKIIQLGRMDDYGFLQKGFQDSLQALFYLESLLGEQASKVEIVFIGKGNKSVELKNGLGKLQYIKFNFFESLPNVEVKELIRKSDVVLIPSRFEGMSMFATECLSLGKAFIFTNDGGMRDMIFDNVNGIAIRPFDYIEIAEAILTFSNDREKLREYSEASVKIFNERFSYPVALNMFNTILNIYK